MQKRQNILHVKDMGGGQVMVAWQRGSMAPRYTREPIVLQNPLADEDRKELRWYLEEFLQFPYGAMPWQAKQVENKMAVWGESLFSQLFAKKEYDPDPRSLYQEAVREGLDNCELCISSDDTAFLNIPWELLRDPTPGRGYLAPSLGGIYRQRSGHSIDYLPEQTSEVFRILLVICRPYGKNDVPMLRVARPMLEALGQDNAQVKVEVLRPPTLDELQKRLSTNLGYYSLVHFDGHGVFERNSTVGYAEQFGLAGEKGHLVFENSDGAEHIVNSDLLGNILANCRVPLFVLNACQSAEEGGQDPYSSVASRLISVGVKGVVAMSYSVYVKTAALFMQRFYENLVQHAPLALSVAQARRRLMAEGVHDTAVGKMELLDWIVPALYQQEHGYVPFPEQKIGTVEESEEKPSQPYLEERCPTGRYGFIGRDYDIKRIEMAFLDKENPFVLLSGLGGIGKTELAFGFARWYAATGGCPGGVFVSSFKEKADFAQVVGSIVGYGTDFSSLAEHKQMEELVNYLRNNRCLLVWDNFEPVNGYPEGEEPLAPTEERKKLSSFVKALRGGKSRVLITTRKPDEDWLGVACTLHELSGLTRGDAEELAGVILKKIGRGPGDFLADPDSKYYYDNLLDLLRGHPRSMEVVLPLLRKNTPEQVIASLQHRIDRQSESVEDASLGFAFTRLSDRAVKHLPFCGLFTGYVNTSILSLFVSLGDKHKQVYTNIIGEPLDTMGWEEILEEAVRSGLVSSKGQQMFVLHPTLPPFLRGQLVLTCGEEALQMLDRGFVDIYASFANIILENITNADNGYLSSVAREEANFLRALHLAETNRQWGNVQAIVQTIYQYYDITSRFEEWRVVCTRLLKRIGRIIDVGAEREQAELWMFLLGVEANYALSNNDLVTYEKYCWCVHDYLLSCGIAEYEPKIAVAYHQLGIVAQERGEYLQAEEWYKKALVIRQRLGLEKNVANDYRNLGSTAKDQGKYGQAEELYKKALEIRERLGLEREAANDYYQLGIIAQEQGEYDQAEALYKKSLEIRERLGLVRSAASDYHQLGIIAQYRGEYGQAEKWFKMALGINERLGLEIEVAINYHELGIMARERREYGQAEEWCKKAIDIRERLKLERDVAANYLELGIIAQERGEYAQAEEWCKKALKIYERMGLERELATSYHNLGIVAQGRGEYVHAEEWYKKSLEISERLGYLHLVVYTHSQLGIFCRLQEKYGASIAYLGQSLFFTIEHKMPLISTIMQNIDILHKSMGEVAFTSAWRNTFGEKGDEMLLSINALMKKNQQSES